MRAPVGRVPSTRFWRRSKNGEVPTSATSAARRRKSWCGSASMPRRPTQRMSGSAAAHAPNSRRLIRRLTCQKWGRRASSMRWEAVFPMSRGPDARSLRLLSNLPGEDVSRNDLLRPAYAPSATCCTANSTTRGSTDHCRRRMHASDDVQPADAAADLSPRNWSAIWPRWQSLDGQRSAICAATARRFHHVPDIISRKAMLRRG